MKVMVTGSEGFIGSNLIRHLFKNYPFQVIRVDALTYAAQKPFPEAENFQLIQADIRNAAAMLLIMQTHKPDLVLHLAAESHVCRSIAGPADFMTTNFMGTFSILEAIRNSGCGARMVHVSTDEVFGELDLYSADVFSETTPMDARSPYAASKAASDMIVLAYARTYGMDVIVTNCSNNFGPNQHDEKLIPRTVGKIMRGEPVTIYGDGLQVRDWLHVERHCDGIMVAAMHGKKGERYCIGGEMELPNRIMIEKLYQCVEENTGLPMERKIIHTGDRPTDDRRYAVNCDKLKALGWNSGVDRFEHNLQETVNGYIEQLRAHKATD